MTRPRSRPQPAAEPEPPPPAPAEPTSDEPIRVGSILDETGPLNIYGTPMVDATRLAVDNINANGGVLGRPLELVEVDSKSDQNEYISGAERLASMDLAVVHGGITSASREAIRPVFDDAEMLYFYNVLYEGGVCDINTFITGTVPTQQVEPLLRWAVENIGPRVYVVAADYNYGQISADWAETYAPAAGAEILATDFFPLDVSEFGTTLSAIQDADPDVIFSFLVGGAHISFYSQFAASGLADEMTIVSTTFGLGNEHIALEPAAQENLYVAYSYFQELDTPENAAFVAAWQDAYGSDYPYITDLAVDTWDGWHMWAEAVERAGTTDREAVIAELQKGANFVSPTRPRGDGRCCAPRHGADPHRRHQRRQRVRRDPHLRVGRPRVRAAAVRPGQQPRRERAVHPLSQAEPPPAGRTSCTATGGQVFGPRRSGMRPPRA